MKLINIYGIAAGISYLHDQNKIHPDSKPDNILLDEKLYTDFGLSKELTVKDQFVLNSAYELKRTPVYCSPEI